MAPRTAFRIAARAHYSSVYVFDDLTNTSTLIREYIWVEGLPFGGVETITGSPMELRFPGPWYQSESRLHQNWMREYDPTTGRYLQGDPLGLVDGASVYGYALQSPGRYTDPRGENAGTVTSTGGVTVAEALTILRNAAKPVISFCTTAASAAMTGTAAFAVAIVYPNTMGDGEICDECELLPPPPDCPFEMPLSTLKKASSGKLRKIIKEIGHPHELKDGSFEDLYVSKNGCVYVGNKDGTGIGRLVGRI